MRSFASFEQFIRHGGQASSVLSFRAAEPVLELKRARLDRSIADAFEHRLRDLAAENWSEISASFARVGIVFDPAHAGRIGKD